MKISQQDFDKYILPFKWVLENMDTKGDEFLEYKREIILNRISGIEIGSDEEDDLK